MKKGEYWFSKLSETEQQEFKKNCNFQFERAMEGEKSFMAFIGFFFDWNSSPQGWEYWFKISKRDVK